MNRNGDEEAGENCGRLGSFYAYKDTFDEDNVWVEVPKNGRSVLDLIAGRKNNMLI
jgi:hypothetical protein